MKCKICQNQENNKKYDVKEMMFGTKDVFGYFECANCGCLQINEFPQNISKYYPADYYSMRIDPQKLFNNPIKNFIKKHRDNYVLFKNDLFGKVFNIIFPETTNGLKALTSLNLDKQAKILDVGCGKGVLLYTLANAGFKNLLGIDPYLSKDLKYKNGLNIFKKSVNDIQEKFDLIMFHHVFEHLENPYETLNTVCKLLNDNGTCLIRIPTASSYAWKHYKENWVQLDAPRHYFLHSLKSMEILAKNSLFKIDKIIYDSTDFQFWGSVQYKNNIPLNSDKSYESHKSAFSVKQIKKYEAKAKELNQNKQGDSIAIYLKK